MKKKSPQKTFIILNSFAVKNVSGGLVFEETTTSPDGTVKQTKKEITIQTPIGTMK